MARLRSSFLSALRVLILPTVLFVIVLLWCVWETKDDTANNFADFDNLEAPDMVRGNESANFRLLTAFSQNHFYEAVRSCMSIGRLAETFRWQNGFMIAYLLEPFCEAQLLYFRRTCPFVELRKMDFSVWPSYVAHLKEYRWKPLLVKQVLTEAEFVFWLDSSTLFHQRASDTIQSLSDEMLTNFNKCDVRGFSIAWHTIFAATDPRMLSHFDMTEKVARGKRMFAATNFIVHKTPKATKIVQEWVECALDENCMTPPGAQLKCDMKKLGRGEYANCHRFDQSALAILLDKCSSKLEDHMKKSSLISINRLPEK